MRAHFTASKSKYLLHQHSSADKYVAIKILEDITDNIEEIEEEYLVLRDLCLHPNIPQFHGMFFRPGRKRDDDQLWFVMEVSSRHFIGEEMSRGWGSTKF